MEVLKGSYPRTTWERLNHDEDPFYEAVDTEPVLTDYCPVVVDASDSTNILIRDTDETAWVAVPSQSSSTVSTNVPVQNEPFVLARNRQERRVVTSAGFRDLLRQARRELSTEPLRTWNERFWEWLVKRKTHAKKPQD